MALIADFVSGQGNVTYTRFRELLLESGGGLQEGVVSATDLKVAQRGAGANPSVDIPAGAAWITVDTGTRNGISHAYSDAVANVTVNAADGTNPRIDQACLQYNDTAIPAGTGGNLPTFRIITGTATATATLDNRLGVAALPNDCLRLADILVPAASTSVVTANIRDRRPWARGAYFTYNSNGAADLSSTSASPTFTALTGSERIEFSGAPVEIEVTGVAWNTLAGATAFVCVLIDGAQLNGQTGVVSPAASEKDAFHHAPRGQLIAAGSHTLNVAAAQSGGGTAVVQNSNSVLLRMVVREVVRPSASNT